MELATLKSLPPSQVEEMMEVLDYRSREIIKLRAGLADGYSYTEIECGKIFSISRERVSVIVENALRKLAMVIGSDESSDVNSIGALNVFIDSGTASPEQVSELLNELSTLYRMLGGSGISFVLNGVKEPVVA